MGMDGIEESRNKDHSVQIQDIIVTVIFLLIIGIMGVSGARGNSQNRLRLEQKLIAVDSLRKKMFNNVSYTDAKGMIIRDKNDRLHALCGKIDNTILECEGNSICLLGNYCAEKDIPFLYVQAPYKGDTYESDLPVGLSDYSGENADVVIKYIKNQGILTHDLRKILSGEEIFFRTDHHWQIETAFLAASDIASTVSNEMGIEDIYRAETADMARYKMTPYEDYIGSYGRRTGSIWSGKERFTYILPDYDTDFRYQHIKKGEVVLDKEGNFKEALISDPRESDYYCSYLNNSYEEMIIENRNAYNDAKILIISDSFGRTMCSFLSLYCKELRNLDTQDGRFDGSLYQYINDYAPDAVIVMMNAGMYDCPEVFARLCQ